jgi:hypothetical protein
LRESLFRRGDIDCGILYKRSLIDYAFYWSQTEIFRRFSLQVYIIISPGVRYIESGTVTWDEKRSREAGKGGVGGGAAPYFACKKPKNMPNRNFFTLLYKPRWLLDYFGSLDHEKFLAK